MKTLSVALALRSLRRSPLSPLAVVLTLALGLAGNVIIFSFVQGSLLRTLPYPQSERLVALATGSSSDPKDLSWGDVRDLQNGFTAAQYVAGYRTRSFGLSVRNPAEITPIPVGMVTADFFRALGAPLLRGQMFNASDESVPAPRNVIISNGLWMNSFGRSDSAIGSYLRLNGDPFRVVGILPPSFTFQMDGDVPDAYIPLDSADYCCARDVRSLGAIARLKPPLTPHAAQSQLRVLSSTLARSYPATNTRTTFEILDLRSYFLGPEKSKLLTTLWIAISLLTLCASLNAGAMLLVRSTRTFRQTAIRFSLGASKWDVVLEHLVSAGALALLSGILALCIGYAVLTWVRLAPEALPLLANMRTGNVALVSLFSLLISLCVGFIASLSPLLAVTFIDLEKLLRSSSTATPPRMTRKLNAVLISLQLGMSIALFFSTTAVARSVSQVLNADPGFTIQNTYVSALGIPDGKYDTDPKQIAFHQAALTRLRAIPGILEVGLGAGLPTNSFRTRLQLAGSIHLERDRPFSRIAFASPELFHLLKIRVLKGRVFAEEDTAHSPLVAVVNKSFARKYLVEPNDVGAKIGIGFTNSQVIKPYSPFLIVGIVDDIRNRSLLEPSEPEVFLSTTQIPLDAALYFFKTMRPIADLESAVPNAILNVDPELERVSVEPLAEIVEANLQAPRLSAALMMILASLALVLTALGLGANIAAYVEERTKEIGLRSALGESRLSISIWVVKIGLRYLGFGVLAGALCTFVLWNVLRSQIVGTGRQDLAITNYLIVGLVVLSITLAASLVPALRALSILPSQALRHD